jgi:serine/threonine-protein kinase HSL1 (negative regulator of Swe1 kinase)
MSIPHHDSLRAGGLLQAQDLSPSPNARRHHGNITSKAGSPANPRLSAISKEEYPSNPNSNRNSRISTVSTNASDGRKIKTMIGPWRLGKTLGRGATARVRLARHAQTGQEAAVKIVQKKNAQMSQAGSLAALDKVMSGAQEDGLRRMPLGIEREVAIMKLIEHPNIMKLYDIWENRHEMYVQDLFWYQH